MDIADNDNARRDNAIYQMPWHLVVLEGRPNSLSLASNVLAIRQKGGVEVKSDFRHFNNEFRFLRFEHFIESSFFC